MASQNQYTSGFYMADYVTTAATTNITLNPTWIGGAGFGGYGGAVIDPLGQLGRAPAPQPETDKQWLRRRVDEMLWRAP